MSKHAEEMRRERLRKRAKGIPHLPPAESPSKLLRRMPEEHPDVLENIEFWLVRAWRDDPRVDDAAADTALRLTLAGEWVDSTKDAQVWRILTALEAMREVRGDISDEVWRDALLTVKQSVRRHSTCRPGERRYLHFTASFVP
jgi:hypothetical protein